MQINSRSNNMLDEDDDCDYVDVDQINSNNSPRDRHQGPDAFML